jgi:hypothetical protein
VPRLRSALDRSYLKPPWLKFEERLAHAQEVKVSPTVVISAVSKASQVASVRSGARAGPATVRAGDRRSDLAAAVKLVVRFAR